MSDAKMQNNDNFLSNQGFENILDTRVIMLTCNEFIVLLEMRAKRHLEKF